MPRQTQKDIEILAKYHHMPELNQDRLDSVTKFNLKFVGVFIGFVIVIGFSMFFLGNDVALYLPLVPIIFGVLVVIFKKEYKALWKWFANDSSPSPSKT